MQKKSRKTYDILELIENKQVFFFFFFNARGCSYEHNIIHRNIYTSNRNVLQEYNFTSKYKKNWVILAHCVSKYDIKTLLFIYHYSIRLRVNKLRYNLCCTLEIIQDIYERFSQRMQYIYIYIYIYHAILKRGHGCPTVIRYLFECVVCEWHNGMDFIN